jgi:hypothetical protein
MFVACNITNHVFKPLQAELADRDFTAERYQPVVISTSAHSTLAAEQSAALRAAAEARNVHKLIIPRRPEWDASTTPEQLDAQEKAAFLSWRRCVWLVYSYGTALCVISPVCWLCPILNAAVTYAQEQATILSWRQVRLVVVWLWHCTMCYRACLAGLSCFNAAVTVCTGEGGFPELAQVRGLSKFAAVQKVCCWPCLAGCFFSFDLNAASAEAWHAAAAMVSACQVRLVMLGSVCNYCVTVTCAVVCSAMHAACCARAAALSSLLMFVPVSLIVTLPMHVCFACARTRCRQLAALERCGSSCSCRCLHCTSLSLCPFVSTLLIHYVLCVSSLGRCRQLAVLEEEEELLLTPFERNLEVWRQLWRVLERSDIVVQVRQHCRLALHIAHSMRIGVASVHFFLCEQRCL